MDSQSRFARGSIFEDDGTPSDDELFGNEDDWLSEDFKDMDQNVRLRTDIHAYCVCDKKSLAIEKFFSNSTSRVDEFISTIFTFLSHDTDIRFF